MLATCRNSAQEWLAPPDLNSKRDDFGVHQAFWTLNRWMISVAGCFSLRQWWIQKKQDFVEQFVADIEPTLVPELEGSWGLLETFFCWAVGGPTVDGWILAPVDAYDWQCFNHARIFFVFLADPAERERKRNREGEREIRIQKEEGREKLRGYSGYDCKVEWNEENSNGIHSRDILN